MVARLAAAHSGEAAFGADGVALVSYRDSRPGAWGQLQILAAQAGVESFRATNAEVLAHLLQELSARRLVLIDTPASQIEVAVNDLRRMAPEARAHLVLPLEASQFTVQRHLRLEGVRWDGLMISRMDQVASPWPILQVLCGGELPVSFGGFGAELGDLIEAADADLLVDRARTTLELALEEQLAPIAND
jgi:flagellar biosynthesis GTPase FlhF